MTVRLSRLARRDLDDIRRYTLDTWGREQWLKYYRGLVRPFEGIMANPDDGRDRSLFAAADNEPVILRIVHQRRNMPALIYFEALGG